MHGVVGRGKIRTSTGRGPQGGFIATNKVALAAERVRECRAESHVVNEVGHSSSSRFDVMIVALFRQRHSTRRNKTFVYWERRLTYLSSLVWYSALSRIFSQIRQKPR